MAFDAFNYTARVDPRQAYPGGQTQPKTGQAKIGQGGTPLGNSSYPLTGYERDFARTPARTPMAMDNIPYYSIYSNSPNSTPPPTNASGDPNDNNFVRNNKLSDEELRTKVRDSLKGNIKQSALSGLQKPMKHTKPSTPPSAASSEEDYDYEGEFGSGEEEYDSGDEGSPTADDAAEESSSSE